MGIKISHDTFFYHVFNPYIKWTGYFATKHQQNKGSKGMHLDAIDVIWLVFQWCNIVVSFLSIKKEIEPSIQTATVVCPAFIHCHSPVIPQGLFGTTAWLWHSLALRSKL